MGLERLWRELVPNFRKKISEEFFGRTKAREDRCFGKSQWSLEAEKFLEGIIECF